MIKVKSTKNNVKHKQGSKEREIKSTIMKKPTEHAINTDGSVYLCSSFSADFMSSDINSLGFK